jgi:hypothetical protein
VGARRHRTTLDRTVVAEAPSRPLTAPSSDTDGSDTAQGSCAKEVKNNGEVAMRDLVPAARYNAAIVLELADLAADNGAKPLRVADELRRFFGDPFNEKA